MVWQAGSSQANAAVVAPANIQVAKIILFIMVWFPFSKKNDVPNAAALQAA
jgi:hypothetical protein